MSPKLFDHYRKKEEVTIGKHLLIECKGRQAFLKEKELRALMEEAAAVAGATVLAHHFHSFGEGCGLTGGSSVVRVSYDGSPVARKRICSLRCFYVW
jgi:S-adenosylmethionine decarboxylase